MTASIFVDFLWIYRSNFRYLTKKADGTARERLAPISGIKKAVDGDST